ncbi:MAG TPA: hypothetical protein VIH99_08885, partial [Bdellovibrionota bacterium]
MKLIYEKTCVWMAAGCAAASFLIGTSVLVLWHIGPAFLLRSSGGDPVMVPNSALAVSISSGALLLIQAFRSPPFRRTVAVAAGFLVFLLGAACLIENILHTPLWINHAYFDLLLPEYSSFTWRMNIPSPLAGVSFLLLGLALLNLNDRFWLTQVFLFLL